MKSTDKRLKKRRMHPNSLANLRPKPFQPGQPSANPKGRPPKPDCLISCIKEELARVGKDGLTKEQQIAVALINKASAGDMRAIEILMSYTTPKPAASIALTDAEGKSLPQPSFFFVMPDGTQKTAKEVLNGSSTK